MAPTPRTAAEPNADASPPVMRHSASLTGRVLLDGRPVRYFGVVVSTNFALDCCQGRATPFRARDGRFAVHGIEPGIWDVVIAGPGFRRVLAAAGRELRENESIELGDITVGYGHTVGGHLIDGAGRPVSGARVSIRSSVPEAHDDELTALARGTMTTTSDRDGAYRFDGVSVFDLAGYAPTLVATAGALTTSQAVSVPNADLTIDLIISAAGGIDGVVRGGSRQGYLVHARPLSALAAGPYASVEADDTFHFSNLPPGDYELQLLPGPRGVASPPLERVTVVANQRAAATIMVPNSAITIAVHVRGPCEMLELKPATGSSLFAPMLADNDCERGDAEIRDVAPGDYRICVGLDCTEITVNASPSRQSFELSSQL